MASEERLQILDMIAQGKITAQQGIELLSALEDEADLAGNIPAEDRPEGDGLPADELAAVEAQHPQEPETRQGEVLQSEASQTEAFQTEAFQTEAVPAAPLPPIMEAVTETPAPEAASEASQPMGSQAIPAVIEDLPENPSFDPRAEKWRGWWRIPLWIGVIATVLTGLLLYSIYNAAGFNFWFACAWFPFMISVAIVALAWASRSAHWIHIRVHQRPGERPQNIAISFPVPLSLMGWFLRTFRSKIPNLQGVNPDEMILALNHVTPEKPFYVEVNEEDGERVEVYIG
jgi:hypothetical protein